MLPTAHIPAVVSAENCLAWSADRELAIAAGEELYILLPRHEAGEPWAQIHFPINEFTYQEWPRQRQRRFVEMSIGEEQATATVISLAWSPPGLAKHRRCALAILTSNLVLSIWAPGGRPTYSECWQRVLVVQNTRVRSAAWLPSHPKSDETQLPPSIRKWGVHILAVADDCNAISFLNISSPYTSPLKSWVCKTLGHVSIPPFPKVNTRASILWEELNAKHFIDYMAFGDWDSIANISMIYRSKGVIYQSVMDIAFDPLEVQLKQVDGQRPLVLENHHQPLEAPSSVDPLMQRQKEHYAKSHHLSQNDVQLKTWGVAFLDELVAVCITSHPARRVEYYTWARSHATVLFGYRNNSKDIIHTFPWQESKGVGEGEICQSIILTISSLLHSSILKLTNLDLKILYAALCATLFCQMSDSERLPCLDTAKQVLNLLETKSSADLSNEHQLVLAMLRDKAPNLDIIDHSMEERDQHPETHEAQLLSACPICGGYVGLARAQVDFWEAYCPSGHPFCVYITSD